MKSRKIVQHILNKKNEGTKAIVYTATSTTNNVTLSGMKLK